MIHQWKKALLKGASEISQRGHNHAEPEVDADRLKGLYAKIRMTLENGECSESLTLMVEIERQFLETPFYGARQMTRHLRAQEHLVNIKRVRRPMRLMDLMPIYQ